MLHILPYIGGSTQDALIETENLEDLINEQIDISNAKI